MLNEEDEGGIPWLALAETAWRRRRTVLAVALGGSLLALIWVLRTPAVYRAHATILLGAKAMSGPRTDAMPDKAIESELALLSSPELIKETLRQMEPKAPPLAPAAEAARVQQLEGGIETNRIEETNVVEVAYRGTDPRWAARFINALLAQHVERIARLDEQANTHKFFQGERDALYGQLRTAGDALNRFRARDGAQLSPDDDADLHKALAQLDNEQAAAQSQRAEAQARVAYLKQEIARHPANIATESDSRETEGARLLDARLMQLEMQRSEAITKYTPGSAMVQSIDTQIADTRRLLAGQKVQEAGRKTGVNPTYQALELDLVQRQAEAAALAARISALAGERARMRGQLDRLAMVTPQLTRLENEQKSAADAYLDYLKKEEEARLNRAFDRSGMVNISVLDPAEAPESPEPAKKGLKLLAGILASLVLGVAAAEARERLDPAVASGAQAERITGVQVIGSVGT